MCRHMRLDYLRLTGLALLFFVPFLGGVHLFDWNEVNIAECSREMLVTGDFLQPQINFTPFLEKPPLFFWMQALSMKVFGVGEFAARFPNALCGIFTLLLVYFLGRRLHDRSFGWLWAFAWLGSLLPHFYFRSGIIDPWFNVLIFAALYGFVEFRWQFFVPRQGAGFWGRYRYLLFGGSILGLAILTQGLMAYLIVLLVLIVYWARYRFKNRGFFEHLVLFSATALALPLLWLGIEAYRHGGWMVSDFFRHQWQAIVAPEGVGGSFVGYYALVLFLGCFPTSVFALPNLWGDHQAEDELLESDTLASCKRSDFATWMQILFWVVLITFSVAQTNAIHYSSLAYFPLTYLGALTIWRAMHWTLKPRIVAVLLPIIGVLIGLAEAIVPLLGTNTDWVHLWLNDGAVPTAEGPSPISWDWWQGIPGLLLALSSVAAWYYWKKGEVWKSAQTVFIGGAVFVAFTLLSCAQCIDHHTQAAVIEFYESKAGEDCYVQPVGFKSYAHLFYTRKKPDGTGPDCHLADYSTLSRGTPGKKVYFVAKSNHLHDLPDLPDCRELYRKNGYVFFERVAK